MKTHRKNIMTGGFETMINARHFGFGALPALLFAMTMTLLTGCATGDRFRVEAERTAEPQRATTPYRLTVRAAGGPTDSALLAQTAACVRTALARKGLQEASLGARVDTFVVVDVGIAPARLFSVAEPDPFNEDLAWPTAQVVVLDPFSETRYDENGVPTNLVKKVSRIKFLRITACERAMAADHPAARILWRVDVTNDNESAALDSYVPSMVAAAMDSLVPKAKGSTIVEIPANDRRLAFLHMGK